MKYGPTHLEIFLTRLAFFFCSRSVYKAFADRLPLTGGEKVLDFGCGMGTVAYYAAKRLHRGHLTCLDISERWLDACRRTLRKYGNVDYLLAGSPALAKEIYDVVYCHFVLHDITDDELERVIPALAGALRPGGVLAFREPLCDTDKVSLIKDLAERSGLFTRDNRITDRPMMGNALECLYIKK
ncbi:MAG TPA: class I SAM-dependent methyltransferase [Candidatus Atribacteria bacterium]|nr:class I SAM-dependent methyltransferase [Candidatus Atribacteria bacterium]